MLLTKYDPFKDLKEFENRFTDVFKLGSEDTLSSFVPAVNTREGEYAYHVEVDLPGVKKEDIHIDISENNVLTISGERKTKSEVDQKEYYKFESSYGKFTRSFTLPSNADVENITANSEDAVLEVVIPKVKEEKSASRKISVK
ncbi:Hsp20/alpha crystallin family protein [bacterium]|nr:Hsp20/alpha crystallin family protein [bacterium]